MNLTFKGFLRSYSRELTGLETDNLKKLCLACVQDAPAAAEAVMVFAAAQGKEAYLVELSKDTWMYDSYKQFVKSLGRFDLLEGFLSSKDAPSRYRKVWQAYRAKKDAIKADRRVIKLMHGKTCKAIQESGLSVYSVCKALNLNIGNVYAYLNKGDVTKVSRDTAREIMRFVCVS